jgi:hypothetical protein
MVAQDASSKDLKTVLTVSISGYGGLMNSADALAKAAGVPEMTMLPKMMLGGPAGPGGLDGSKPLGLVVQTDGQKFPVTAFVPITDAGKFVEFLKAFVKDIPEPDADGVYEVETGGRSVFIQQKNGWAFAVVERAALADTPADPAALLGGMEKEFALAIRAQVANVPKELRSSAMMVMQMAASAGSQRKEDETDQQYALRQNMTKQSLDGIQKLVNELDLLTIGLGVDANDGAVNLDVAMTAVEGSSLAKDMADTAGLKSNFAGFFNPDAALTFRVTGKLSESDVTQALQIFDVVKEQGKKAIEAQGLGEEQTRLALEIGAELLDVAEEAVEGREFDGGLALAAGDYGIALITGGHLAGAAKLEEIFKKVVERAKKDEPDVDQFLKMNAAEYKGVRFHTLSVPAAMVFEEGVPPAYADSDVKITLGFGDSAVFLAHGRDPVALLKAAIDRSAAAPEAAVVPAQLSLSARAIGNLLETISASQAAEIPQELIAALKQAGDRDHLLISSEAIPNGMKSRLTIESGVLKVIGAAVKALSADGFPGV